MPGCYAVERNWKRWYAAQKIVTAEMVAAGWRVDARKFDEVCTRKTWKRYSS